MVSADLDFVGEEMDAFLTQQDVDRDVWRDGNMSEFGSRAGNALGLILEEKEILVFSMLQWAAIAAGYYLWVQMLGWIPIEVWESDSKIYDIPLNLAFLAWSFLCVMLVAYPISILTAAMGAAHFLRRQGEVSTVAACLAVATQNSRRLWTFHTIDGWVTVDMILERLPKRDYAISAGERAIQESLYYAWKVGTIAVPSALLAGRGLVAAARESMSLVMSRPWDVIKLRGGYSAVCWFIGSATYVLAIVFFVKNPELFESEHGVFTFYYWMGVPILTAVGVIKLFVRPLFVIASCQLYSDYLDERGEIVRVEGLPGRWVSTFVAFLLFCLLVAVVFLYREELGLSRILSVVGA